MKILFFSRLFYPHVGGVEKHVYEISQWLIAKGHQVVVVTEKYDKILKDEEFYNGIEIYRIPVDYNWFKKFQIWFWLLKHLNLFLQADLTHCHDIFFWYFPLKIIFPSKKVFVTFHGYESFPLSKKQILMHQIAAKFSKGNISIGDFIPKWYGTKANFISYGATNVSLKHVSSKYPNSAVFIGRLDDQTGIEIYNEAYKILIKKYPDFKLIVAGDGPVKSLLDKRITALGFVNSTEKLLENCHFAFVSRYLAILDAMAAKRLVFAVYDDPIKKDYLLLSPFANYCVVTNSAEDLAKKVDYYFTHPKEEGKMVQLAYDWVKRQTWEALTGTYLDLWGKN